MAVIFFQGFDIENLIWNTGIVPLGLYDHDGFPDWSHGGGLNDPGMGYQDGYLGGRSYHWRRSITTLTESFSAKNEVRASFYWKPRAKGSATQDLFGIGNTDGDAFYMRAVGVDPLTGEMVGGLVIHEAGVGSTSVLTNFTISDDWAHYEFYVNSATGEIEVKVDGSAQVGGTVTMPSAAQLNSVHMRGSIGVHMMIDHLIVTDGESLWNRIGYQGVAVLYSAMNKAISGTDHGIRSRLTKDGTTVYSSTRRTYIVDHWAPAVSHAWHDYWMTNPFTGEEWGTAIDIDQWGLCRTDDNGGHIMVPSAQLSFIEMNSDGAPLVRYAAPEEAKIVDVTWVRTHEARPWHEHVDNYPRLWPAWNTTIMPFKPSAFGDNPNPFDPDMAGYEWNMYEYDEFWYEDYLGATGPGCISFNFEPPEPPTLYGGTGLAFAEEYRVSYRDWESIIKNGEEFTSYFISGYKIHGEGNKKFQSNYLTVNFETDVLGSAYIQGVWDYSLSNEPDDGNSRSDTGRWGQTQQVYGPRNSVDYKHAFSKLKIRGHGKAMQLKVKSEDGKPFYINGWAMFVSGNSTT